VPLEANEPLKLTLPALVLKLELPVRVVLVAPTVPKLVSSDMVPCMPAMVISPALVLRRKLVVGGTLSAKSTPDELKKFVATVTLIVTVLLAVLGS